MKKRLLPFVLVVILSFGIFLPTNTAFASPSNTTAQLVLDFQDIFDYLGIQGRQIQLTNAAREIALSDFDHISSVILEASPIVNIVYRRLGITMQDFLSILRGLIYDGVPMLSLAGFEVRQEFLPASEDDLKIAADYLYSILTLIAVNLGGLGHLMPNPVDLYEMRLFNFSYFVYYGEYGFAVIGDYLEEFAALGFDIYALADAARRQVLFNYEIFNSPQSIWFYGVDTSLFDFTVSPDETFGSYDEDNLVLDIIKEDEVAYLRVNSFMNNVAFDSGYLMPFFEQIQDYEHLIIDLRGNGGGIAAYFNQNIVSRLISEPLGFTYYQFFMESQYSAPLFVNPVSLLDGIITAEVPIFPAADFVAQNDFPLFNADDLAILDYVIVRDVVIRPSDDAIPFNGEIWLLIDHGSASASDNAAKFSIKTGFATVVGEPSAGVTGVIHMYVSLPQTGIIFRVDLGYTIDDEGRSIEEFGVVPQIPNLPGLDALQTVLQTIGVEFETPDFVPLRVTFNELGAIDITWDTATFTARVYFDGMGAPIEIPILDAGGFVVDGVSWIPYETFRMLYLLYLDSFE